MVSSMYIESMRTVWVEKTVQEKSTIFVFYILFTKENRHILVWWYPYKMSRYFHYAYCLQVESTHFGPEVHRQFGVENYKWNITDSFRNFWIILTFHEQLSVPNSPKTETTFCLTNPIFCNYLTKLIYF